MPAKLGKPVGVSFPWNASMPSPIEPLVSAYVSLKDWKALERMRDLRRRLLIEEFWAPTALKYVQEDLRVIEEGLAHLRGSAVAPF